MGHNGKSWQRKLRHWKNRPMKETCIYCLKRFRSRKERYTHEKGCESAQIDDEVFEFLMLTDFSKLGVANFLQVFDY